jgi:hypothetical protein
MAINYSWNFTLRVLPAAQGLSDIVSIVNWIYTGNDSNTGAYVDALAGSFTLPPPDPTAFIPLSSMTNATIQAWVESIIGPDNLTKMQNHIASKYANMTYQTTLPS